jgi:hypothetical protein
MDAIFVPATEETSEWPEFLEEARPEYLIGTV